MLSVVAVVVSVLVDIELEFEDASRRVGRVCWKRVSTGKTAGFSEHSGRSAIAQ